MKSLMESWNRFSVEIEKEQVLVEHSVKNILADKKLRKLFLEDYKATLSEGQEVTEEGFRDFVGGIKDKAARAAKKVKNVAKGIADIGFLGRGSTLLGGEETFDIEKRKEKVDDARVVLEYEIDEIAKQFAKANLEMPVDLKKVYDTLNAVEFPNNINNADFKSSLQEIEDAHTKVVNDWQQKKFDSKTANAVISVLRHMVIFFQDFKIADKYLYIKEEVASIDTTGVSGKSMDDRSANVMAAYSNKLPVGLALAGASMMGLGVAANSDLFQSALEGLKDMKDANPNGIARSIAPAVTAARIGKTLAGLVLKPGWGPTQILARNTGVDMSPNATVAEAFADPKVQELIPALKGAFKDPNGAAVWDKASALAKANPDMTFAELFGARGVKALGFGKDTEFYKIVDVDLDKFKVGAQEALTPAVEQEAASVVAQNAKIPANTLKNKFLSSLGKYAGPLLQSLGLGAIVGAAVSKGMRAKGQRSSRMASLDNLYKLLVDVGEKTTADELGKSSPKAPESGEGATALIAAAASLPELPNNQKALAVVQQKAQSNLLGSGDVEKNAIESARKELLAISNELKKMNDSGDTTGAAAKVAYILNKNGIKISDDAVAAILPRGLLKPLQAASEKEEEKESSVGEPLMNSFREELFDSASTELMNLISSDEGKAFVAELEKNLNDPNKKYTIFEQEEAELFLVDKVNDLVGDNINLKVELFQILEKWATSNNINAQEVKNELTELLPQLDREEEPPEDKPEDKPSEDADPLTKTNRINSLVAYSPEKTKYLTAMTNAGLGIDKQVAGTILDTLFASKLLAQAPSSEQELTTEELKQIESDMATVKLAQIVLGKENWKDVVSSQQILLLKKPFKDAKIPVEKINAVLKFLFDKKKLYLPVEYRKLGLIKIPGTKQGKLEPKQEQLNEELNRWKKLAGIIK